MRERSSPILVFGVCLGFWLVLSGHFDPLTVALGVVSALAVAWANRDVELLSGVTRSAAGFAAYLPWLLKEIVVANVQVVRLILDPRLPIDPVVVRYRAPLASDLALTTLGNSITLTPGTVTLDVERNELTVHALTRDSADAVLEGSMARRVGHAYRDPGA